MKAWIVPALVAAALAGYAAGRGSPARGEPPAPGAAPVPAPPLPLPDPSHATPPALPVAPQASPLPRTPKQRLVEMLSGHLDVDRLFDSLRNSLHKSPKLQRDLLEILKTADDPALIEECQYMVCLWDPALQKDALERFAAETHPERRLAWACVLGGFWGEDLIRPTVLALLEGNDAKTQERLLLRLSLQGLPGKTPEADREAATASLRLLAGAGGTETLRAAAAASLRGVNTPQDVTLLINLMLADPSARVQHEAFESLPSNYRSPSPLLAEQTRAMYEAALDDRRPARFRKDLASRALDNSGGPEPDSQSVRFLTVQERATLSALLGP